MMAQLDMPAMVFTAIGLLLFLRRQYAMPPCVYGSGSYEGNEHRSAGRVRRWMLLERRWRPALYFTVPAFALARVAGYLYQSTGYLFGNAEFAHYNVGFQLHPVRLGVTLIRRVYYIFIANWHIIGTTAIVMAWRRTQIFRTREWAIVAAVGSSADVDRDGARRSGLGTISHASPAALLHRVRPRLDNVGTTTASHRDRSILRRIDRCNLYQPDIPFPV